MTDVFNPTQNVVTATVITETPLPPPLRHVVLTMPWDVAITLRSLMGTVGGDSRSTYRSDLDEIEQALAGAQVPYEVGRKIPRNGWVQMATRP